MEEKDKEKYRLKIFLVKDEFFDEDLLKEGVENIENFSYVDLIVYYKKHYGKAPKWFTSLFGQADIGIMLSGISGYFTKKIQVSEDIFKQFVITFGGAEKYLKQEYFDQTFGRRIALNLEDGFYQIKRAKISTTQAKTREDATKRKMLSDFDIEYGLDLITSVVVNPKENSFIEGKITGSSFVSFSNELKLENLDSLLLNCYNESLNNEYLKKYSWIDKISEITNNPDLINKIKEKAFSMYLVSDENFWFGANESIRWESIESFEISYQRVRNIIYSSDDIDLEMFKANTQTYSITTLDDLKKFKVSIKHDDGYLEENVWDIFSCVYCELELDGDNYVINSGRFFKIDTDYSKQVEEQYKNIKLIDSLAENTDTQKESEYIDFICKNNNYIKLDCKCVSFETPIEICDIFDSINTRFIHIKKEASASLLSHLFSQAKISAKVMSNNKQYKIIREEIKEKADYYLPEFDFNKFEIVVAIITRKKKDNNGLIKLSFFSKINLILTIDQIRGFGYKNISVMFICSTAPLYNKKANN